MSKEWKIARESEELSKLWTSRYSYLETILEPREREIRYGIGYVDVLNMLAVSYDSPIIAGIIEGKVRLTERCIEEIVETAKFANRCETIEGLSPVNEFYEICGIVKGEFHDDGCKFIGRSFLPILCKRSAFGWSCPGVWDFDRGEVVPSHPYRSVWEALDKVAYLRGKGSLKCSSDIEESISDMIGVIHNHPNLIPLLADNDFSLLCRLTRELTLCNVLPFVSVLPYSYSKLELLDEGVTNAPFYVYFGYNRRKTPLVKKMIERVTPIPESTLIRLKSYGIDPWELFTGFRFTVDLRLLWPLLVSEVELG